MNITANAGLSVYNAHKFYCKDKPNQTVHQISKGNGIVRKNILS